MRLTTLLCVILLIWPWVGRADPANEFVEALPTGHINWSKGILTAKGLCTLDGDVSHDAQRQAQSVQKAHRKATRNLFETIKGLRLDATRHVADVIAANELFGAKLIQMADDAQVVQEVRLSDGSVEVAVQMALLGEFLQMMLPEEIRQVEPIKPVNGSADGTKERLKSLLPGAIPDDEGIYTGLVVDARGIGAQPAMVSLIVDESGKEVYGSAFVSREYAVQHGVCEYVRAGPASALNPRVAPKPLVAKGLRTFGERNCDIVISNTDAAKLRGASANLGFLKQCRVIIILD